MSIIGEAVLTASVELLLNKLVSSELLRFPGQEKIQAELKQWEKKFNNINAVLADAEEKQITNPVVKAWLVELQILAYDVEDILDEFATKLSLESEATATTTTSKAKRLLVNLNPQFKFNLKMRSKIKEITKRLQDITDQKNDLKLIAYSEKRPNKVREGRIPTTSLNEAHVYGREKDQEAIVELLLKDEDNEDGISVIPIVGIGGVGKTTLAQNVYNDVRVESHFDLKAWSCVSDDFDVIRVTQAILQFIAPETRDSSDLNKLQVDLKGKLLGKKFLIVLDDIWNENPYKLGSLIRPFKSNSPGGKIIVTTRSDNVSAMVGTRPAYPLEVLSDDDCLSIFARHSLGREGFNGHPEFLKKIGEDIVKRCKGLPLAAKTLGGLLRNNTNYNYWEHVLNSKIWNLPTKEGDIMPALRLSYHYLPPHLKPCFAYCSLLPKDYEFQKEEIILLWMAQGFLQQKGSAEEQMEDLGDNYFRELQSRSFFQQSSGSSDTSWYVMHDLINDLAQWVAGEFYFRMENIVEGDNQKNISKNLRHLSYISDGQLDGIKKFEAFYGVKNLSNLTYNGGLYDGVKIFEPFNDLRHLRTFLPLMLPLPMYGDYCYLTCDILNNLPKLGRLRILSLKGYYITELSDAVGDLKHLRYLDLSHTAIDVLSKSVGRLHNLQTLKLQECLRLKKCCEEMENLVNLRYLNFSRTDNLGGMPLKIGKLTSLRTLSNFVVGKNTNCRLKELKSLKHLRGTLRISGLENVNDAMDAKEADLSGKKNITELLLKWGGWIPGKERIETEVLDMLRPCNEKLEKLIIDFYGGTMFPTWLGDTSFWNLVYLSFQNCRTCTSLPSVGQLPSLKELYIKGMPVKRVGQELYGNGCSRPFPKLEILRLSSMYEWEEWISHEDQEDGGLPQLRELIISECPKLQGRLPKHLPYLKKLHIHSCKQLQVSVLNLPADCNIEISGCKQVEISHVFLIEEFRQRLSQVEDVKIVGYKEATSFVKDDFECLAKLPQASHNFSFLLSICIANCPGLVSFPDAGLPAQLKSIFIQSCDALKSLPESWMENTSLECLSIYACGSLTYLARSKLTPNLKWLVIKSCSNLQTLMQEENNNLQSSISGIAVGPSLTSSLIKSELPATLEYIAIQYCSNFTSLSSSGNLPKALKQLYLSNLKIQSVAKSFQNTCLEEIEILGCSSLVSFPVGELSSMNLVTIRIDKCEKLEGFTDNMHQLNDLQVTGSDCSRLVSFPERRLSSVNLTQLTIKISDCSSLVAFPDGGLPFTNLTELIIENCVKLEVLPSHMQQLNHLRKIKLSKCASLVSLPVGELSSTNLVTICIRECEKLEAFTDNMHQLNHLQVTGSDCSRLVSFPERRLSSASLTQLTIKISDCSSLVSFPDRGLPFRNLTELIIENCVKLEVLPNHMQQLNHLRKIEISKCSSLVSFPDGGFPSTSLTELIIENCEKLEALPNHMQQLNHLRKIEISKCSSLVSFPDGGFPSTSLTELIIKNCEQLEALPNHMHNLTSLRELEIENCPAIIKSFPPEEGFPTNLTLLNIRKLKIFKPLSEWGLHRLTSLEFLQIEGCQDAVSFPMEEMLPASLMAMDITDFPNLKCLSSPIQNLSSLKGLQLSKCPKLKFFPKKGLPLSLLVLWIDQCPLLEQKCKKSSGKYWPLIAHIPEAEIKNGEQDD